MEKKNIILYTIISIATLLVAVVSATFAYFASSATGASKIVNVTTASSAAFSSNITGSLDVYAGADNMADDAAHKGVWVGTNTATVNATLSGNSGTYCTYDIIFTRTSADDVGKYTPKTGSNPITGGGLYLKALWNGTSATAPANATGSSINYTTEAEFTSYPASNGGTYKLGSGKITVPSGSVTTTTSLAVTISFKNESWDQVANSGKQFKGTLSVTNVVCKNGNATVASS